MFPNKSVVFFLFLVSKLFVLGCSDASSAQAKSISVTIHCEIMLTLLDTLTTFVHLKIFFYSQQVVLLSTVLSRESDLEICFTVQEG